MREMGAIPLLNREGEVAIFKRMETGVNLAGRELVRFSASMYQFIRAFDRVESGEVGLSDLVAGMINLNPGSESMLKGRRTLQGRNGLRYSRRG